jgi:hypothetical protein
VYSLRCITDYQPSKPPLMLCILPLTSGAGAGAAVEGPITNWGAGLFMGIGPTGEGMNS